MKNVMTKFLFAALIVFSVTGFAHKAMAAEMKVAYVDVAVLFDDYQKTKDNDAELKVVGEQKEAEREEKVKEIRALKDELVLLSDEAKEEKQEALDDKIRELQEFENSVKQDLGTRRNQLVREIFRDIDDVVQRYGERKGYDLIFHKRVLLYSTDKLDVTKEVLAELNKGYKK